MGHRREKWDRGDRRRCERSHGTEATVCVIPGKGAQRVWHLGVGSAPTHLALSKSDKAEEILNLLGPRGCAADLRSCAAAQGAEEEFLKAPSAGTRRQWRAAAAKPRWTTFLPTVPVCNAKKDSCSIVRRDVTPIPTHLEIRDAWGHGYVFGPPTFLGAITSFHGSFITACDAQAELMRFEAFL